MHRRCFSGYFDILLGDWPLGAGESFESFVEDLNSHKSAGCCSRIGGDRCKWWPNEVGDLDGRPGVEYIGTNPKDCKSHV